LFASIFEDYALLIHRFHFNQINTEKDNIPKSRISTYCINLIFFRPLVSKNQLIMSNLKFTDEELQKFDEINAIYTNDISEKVLKSSGSHLIEFGSYLKTCESYHTNSTYKTEGYVHDMENMLALFIINHLIDEGFLTKKIREHGLPKSDIDITLTGTEEKIETIIELILNEFVAEDGTLYYFSKYCQLDLLWTVVLVLYAYHKYIDPFGIHDFVEEPRPIKNPIIPPSKAKIAIIGDWGTGIWQDGDLKYSPAELVINGVESLNPDYVIHLGDVYYAGTNNEEKQNLVKILEKKSLSNLYTMNSNHEMYDGAKGLYKESLSTPLFTGQRGRTYFSIDIGNWILVGLDSAYHDDSALYMKGSLYRDIETSAQHKFLNDISKQGKPIVLMTHHNGIGVADHKLNVNHKLWNQVTECLGGQMPDMWYWGHVHNGVVYNTEKLEFSDGTVIPKSTTNKTPQFRCCGHASMPFGNGSGFYKKESGVNVMIDEIDYYAHTKLDTENPTPSQKERVLNGFAMLEIDGSEIKETFYEVSNKNPTPNPMWSSK
jgi:hypothetical protein